MTVAGITSLLVGLIIGYMGQRSRMCFVGGIRDYILVRDATLVKGVVAFALTAWLAFPALNAISGIISSIDTSVDPLSAAAVLIGGFGVGFVSVLANGCPFRQHVLAAQGVISSISYLLGFYLGGLLFHLFLLPLLFQII